MPNSPTLEELQLLAQQVRRDIVRMVYGAASGHPGGALGCVEYFLALYGRLLRYDPQNFTLDAKGEDLFILSNGHISPVWYSVLARFGYFDIEELATFRKINSRLQGHPATMEGLPGIRLATGSLGQGLSVALGAALAKKMDGEDRLVFCLTGDGELNEGQIWEAAQFAAHHKIDNLIVTVDLNYKQIDGDTRDVMNPGDLGAKFQSFGWRVHNLKEGNSMSSVLGCHEEACKLVGKGKPQVILMHTVMGKGVDYMEGRYEWHGKPPNDQEYAAALEQLPEVLADY